MKYTTANNSIISDEDLEKMAQEWERGDWKGHLENVTLGLPKPEESDEMTVVSFRIPKSRIAAINAAIKSHGISKSEFYRNAVDRELIALS